MMTMTVITKPKTPMADPDPAFRSVQRHQHIDGGGQEHQHLNSKGDITQIRRVIDALRIKPEHDRKETVQDQHSRDIGHKQLPDSGKQREEPVFLVQIEDHITGPEEN